MTKTNWVLDDAVEVILPDDDAFLKIRETLQRIGIPSYKNQTLFQSAHILHKKGIYRIIHFKCLFALDGKIALFDNTDWHRQNRIAQLLDDWNLCSITYPEALGPLEDANKIKILKHNEKENWTLVAKYNIGV
jgi:hypothetical protein